MPPSRLTINECFYTFQGEGVNMGRPAFFIRTQGCDQDCWFCDSASTWHKDWKPLNLRKATPAELVEEIEGEVGSSVLVVITGGEPCLYDLNPLCDLLLARGHWPCIETAGHRPLPRDRRVHITLSPKPFAAHPLPENIPLADEFKIIVSDQTSMEEGLMCIDGCHEDQPIWLHPEWSHRSDPETLGVISEAVRIAGRMHYNMRAGYQLHKLYAVDLEAAGSRKEPVPLGGTGGSPW